MNCELAVAGLLRGAAAVGDRADVVGGDVDAVFPAQQVLDEHAQRIRELTRVVDDRVEPEDVVRTVTDGEARTCTEAVESHGFGGYPPPCGRRHCGRRRRHQAGGRLGARRRHARRTGRRADAARRRRRRAVRDADRPRRRARRVRRGRRSASAAAGRWTRTASTCRRSTSPRGAAFPLRARLAAHTGLPVWVDNDAKALALGEGWTGAARGRARLHRDGRVDRRRRRHRARRPPARRRRRATPGTSAT